MEPASMMEERGCRRRADPSGCSKNAIGLDRLSFYFRNSPCSSCRELIPSSIDRESTRLTCKFLVVSSKLTFSLLLLLELFLDVRTIGDKGTDETSKLRTPRDQSTFPTTYANPS